MKRGVRNALVALSCVVLGVIGLYGARYVMVLRSPGLASERIRPGQDHTLSTRWGGLLAVEGNWRGEIVDVRTEPVQLADGTRYKWAFEKISSRSATWSNDYSLLDPRGAENVSTYFTVLLPDDYRLYDQELQAEVTIKVTWSAARSYVVNYRTRDESQTITEKFSLRTVGSKALVEQLASQRTNLLVAAAAGLTLLALCWAYATRENWLKRATGAA